MDAYTQTITAFIERGSSWLERYIAKAEEKLGLVLKDKQCEAVCHFCRGNDVFILLPMGYGKLVIPYTWYTIWQIISLANWDVMNIGRHFSLVNKAILSVYCS